MKTTAIPIVKVVVAMKMLLAKLAKKQNVQKEAVRSKAKWNCQLARKVCREGEGTGELQLMGLKFSGRSTKTSIHLNLHLPKFTERPGILVDATEFSPVNLFYMFFPDEAFTLISNETNRYAGQYLDTPVDFEPSYRFRAWNDTSPNEIRVFVALEIAMGLCQKPAHSDYWSGFWLTAVPFSSVMSRNRFELLLTFLHFLTLKKKLGKGKMVTTLYLKYSVF